MRKLDEKWTLYNPFAPSPKQINWGDWNFIKIGKDLKKMACFGPLAALSLNSVEKCVRFCNLLIYPYPAKFKTWVVKSWQYFQLFLTFSNPIWIIVLSAQNWYFKLLRKIYFQDHYKKCSRIIFWNVLSARSFLQCFRLPLLTFDVIVQLTIEDCIFKRFELGEFLRPWSLNNINTRKHKRCLP